jgi:hypothetical protein
MIPVVGWVPDGVALVDAVRAARNGEAGSGVAVLAAGVGFVPGIGDGLKAAIKGGQEAAGAAASAASAAAAAAARRSTPERVRLGEGTFAVVFQEGDEVVKILKPVVGRHGEFYLRRADLEFMARTQAELSNSLRFVDDLGTFIPETRAVGGTIRQRVIGGREFMDLVHENPAATRVARDEMEDILRRARAHIGERPVAIGDDGWMVGVDGNWGNFRFSRNGHVTGWFDPIVVFPPPSRME